MRFAQLLILTVLPSLYYAAPVVDKCMLLGTCGQSDSAVQVITEPQQTSGSLTEAADTIRDRFNTVAAVTDAPTNTQSKMNSALGISASQDEVMAEYSSFFDAYDEDKDGSLNKIEFEKVLVDRNIRMHRKKSLVVSPAHYFSAR
jgi:hypothetical protein